MNQLKNLCVLGSTGSIGTNSLEVVALHPQQYRIFGLSANQNTQALFDQCIKFNPKVVVLTNSKAADDFGQRVTEHSMDVEVRCGSEALCELASLNEVDVVIAGIVGAAGLASTIAAIEAGKRVLIANKEPIVMTGSLLLDKARQSGAQIMPVDSEHNAIMQCLPGDFQVAHCSSVQGLRKLHLTGSGGPFLTTAIADLPTRTPTQALAHPNWTMGQKISVDSATMMNKSLELIEACNLFEVPESKIDVLIHPQSVIHSMAEYEDGSVIAQMGSPDMKIPIANALAWPRRIKSGAKPINFLEISALTFQEPDALRYPSLELARQVINQGGSAASVMNGANEVAVEGFLNGRIKFTQIVELVKQVLDLSQFHSQLDIESVLAADKTSRQIAERLINQHLN